MNAKNVMLLLILVGAVFVLSACDTQLGHSEEEHDCDDGHGHEGCDDEHDKDDDHDDEEEHLDDE